MPSVITAQSSGFPELALEVAKALTSFGFALKSVNNTDSTELPSDKLYHAWFTATSSVDPNVANQGWSLIIEASQSEVDEKFRYLDIFLLPTSQVTSNRAPVYSPLVVAGKLSREGKSASHFIHLVDEWGQTSGSDVKAHPIEMYAVSTDHGVAFSFNPDGLNNEGRAQSWFVVQRLRDPNTGLIPVNSPLVCLFSTCGGCILGNPDAVDTWGVSKMFVREFDSPYVSLPVPAATMWPDSYPMICVTQQVTFTHDGRFLLLSPMMVNSSRYLYPLQMDMLYYTSADALAYKSLVDVKLPASPISSKYTALGASGNDNRGVRVLLPN